MTQTEPSLRSLWRGTLNHSTDWVQSHARTLAGSISEEDSERFARKMIYWRSHTPQQPMMITATHRGILEIAQGRSRFLAAAILGQPWPCRVFVYSRSDSESVAWLEQILVKGRVQHLGNRRPYSQQKPVRGFRQALDAVEVHWPYPRDFAGWQQLLEHTHQ